MEEVVDCFEEDGLRGGEGGVRFCEGRRFGGIGDEGFFDEDVFSGTEGPERPFVVEAVGERDVDCVDGGVVKEGWARVSFLCCANGKE